MFSVEDIKSYFSSLRKEKPFLFCCLVLLPLFFICALVILLVQTAPAPKIVSIPKEETVIEGEILFPQESMLEKDYYPSRTKKQEWSMDEALEYFSPPDGNLLKEVEKSNDRIIKEITGASL